MAVPTVAELAARKVYWTRGGWMVLHDEARDRYISHDLAATGTFEAWETELVSAEVRPGDWVADVGANIGYYTLLFARWVGPRGRVFAFEPDPANFAILEHNVRINGLRNVVLVQKAVSDKAAVANLFNCSFNQGDHRLYDSADGRPSVPVETTDLDTFFAQYPARLSLVKFDTQGSEWRALQGMRQLIQRHPRLKIVLEFWPYGLTTAGADPMAVLDFLKAEGFSLYEIEDHTSRLSIAVPDHLLKTYPVEHKGFTNLMCVKLPSIPKPTPDTPDRPGLVWRIVNSLAGRRVG